MHRRFVFALVVGLGPSGAAGCAPRPASAPSVAVNRGDSAPRLSFIENDAAAAMARARAEGKLLFVDAWAPWCHTCLSMRNFVLSDASLAPLAEQLVFLSLDTDRAESAAFLERHPVEMWPTFFVLDPATDQALGLWAGAASVREIRALCGEALAEHRETATDPISRATSEGRRAREEGNWRPAAAAFERAVSTAPANWPDRSAALVSWIESLEAAEAWDACLAVGEAHVGEVEGSSAPGDFAAMVLACADRLPPGAKPTSARRSAVSRLQRAAAHPSADASLDDRQDALGTLASGLTALGDEAGARAVTLTRLALLEKAAGEATTPERAQTFDYARANVYADLGRGEEAVSMLTQREHDLPDSYEPPARLARVLHTMGRESDALGAIDRALKNAYGPRRLRYLTLRADILEKLGDPARAIAARRQEVQGWEALPPGQGSKRQLADAKKRLADAEKREPPSR